MAKSSVIIVASALCLLSLIGATQASIPQFIVNGKVYCDTCRAHFLTRASHFLEGATVRLVCRDEQGLETFTAKSTTDASGTYNMKVDGDHEEEVCEIVLVSSPDNSCAEIPKGEFLRNSAKISLTNNNGITGEERSASPLGFLKKERLAECAAILEELDLDNQN